jgi:hypothetical protein
MNDAHKIAVFGKNVYILYVADMVGDCGILILAYRLRSSKNVTYSI